MPAWQAVQSVSAILNNISLKQHLQKAMSNPTSRLTAADKKLPLSAAARPAWPVLTSLTRQATALPFMNVPDRAGGLLMYGIPNMKLDKHLVERRIKLLEEAGVTFELNSEIGHKISSETLLKQFDAIALCTGSTVPRDLTIPGRELQGIHFAKDYLHSVTKSFLDSSLQDKKAVSAKGKDVIVIGGGDTGTDCVATAIRQGCRSVKQIEIMPCLPHSRTADNPWPEMPRVFKTDYGQEEAFELYHQDPRDYCIMSKEFIGKNGKVDKLRLCQIDWQKEDGRLIPVEIAGTEQIVSAQLVLLAMGFIGTETQLFDEFKFARSEANTIAANDNDYMTSIPGIFCGWRRPPRPKPGSLGHCRGTRSRSRH